MIRFYNARVLTMAKGTEIQQNAEVWTDGDKISFVGVPTRQQLDEAVFERQTDLKGDLIMPGLKNAHTHSAMTFLRSYADDLPLQDWLFKQVFPMEAKLNEDRIYHLTKLAILEYLTCGCTAAFDMYFFRDGYVRACVESGFRSVMCGSVSGEESRLCELEDEIKKYNSTGSGLISYMLGIHAEYTCSKGLIKGLGELARKYKAPTAMHNSETQKEVDECISRYGMTPTQLFESVGAFDFGGTTFHNVYLTLEDMDIFRRRKVVCVHCPASNLKLASGIAPVAEMEKMGIEIALGTDGPASNNALDMFREMYLMTTLQKVSCKDASACRPQTVLKAVTVGGARAMCLDECDIIAPGKQADLVVIDLNKPNMQPLNNIPANIVYSADKTNVRLTMCAGKVLYENGEFFVGDDVHRIYANANRIINEMKNEV
ncbi:amidohydrolase [Ruminococcus sp. FC2018]|uniref:amidohydrolase family protein n=1 Tax=Ruminococcus sp. FC2018 TaxID=1410617 RepID=UPI00048C5F7B|nr:amidohydrolase [Ruminococcus sp. FC2018]